MAKLSKTLKYIALSGFLFSGNLLAVDSESSYGFKKLTAELCKAAAMPESASLRGELRNARTNLRNIYLSVDCNGKSLLEVAELNQAADVARYIQAKTRGLGSKDSEKVAMQ